MEALLEIYNADELSRALQVQPNLIAINNRNLKNFSMDFVSTPNKYEKNFSGG